MYKIIQKLRLDLIKKFEGREVKPPWFYRLATTIKSNLIINSVSGFIMPFFNVDLNPVLILTHPSLNLYYSNSRSPPTCLCVVVTKLESPFHSFSEVLSVFSEVLCVLDFTETFFELVSTKSLDEDGPVSAKSLDKDG